MVDAFMRDMFADMWDDFTECEYRLIEDVDVFLESADVLIDVDGSWDASVALDRDSYRSLKNHWMRCRLASKPGREGDDGE